jgi:hypothetical protein
VNAGRRDDQQQRRWCTAGIAEAVGGAGWHTQKATWAHSPGPFAGAELELAVDCRRGAR